jgi:flagellar protein FliS
MSYKKIINQYEQTNVTTASKIGLVILCYDKAVQSLKLAKKCYESKEYESKANALQRAIRIINELQGSLDKEKGGAIADNLDSLYSYLVRRLLEGDLRGDLSIFDEAVVILSELKNAWEAIASKEAEKTSSVPASGHMNFRSAQVAA